MVSARVQGSRVEDVSARTPTTATFANPDGTWTVEAHSGVVRSKSDAGQWVPVDPRVERAGKVFEPKAAPFGARFSDGGDRRVGSVATGGDSSVTVRWPRKLPEPVAEGATLRYPDAAPGGADLVVGSLPNGFSYSMVLDEAPAADAGPVEFRVPLEFEGLSAKVREDGSIVLRDGSGRVATMTAPVMWDAANAGLEGERHPVAASVEGEGDSRVLVLRPDMGFLADPETAYPVTVDPTVTLNVAYDTWVDSLTPSGSQISSPELRVGSTSLGISKSRSYLYFDFTQLSGLPPAVVTSAELQLTNFDTGSCSGSAVRMSQITGAYNIATMTWGSQPATTATGSATSTAAFGKSACAGEGVMSFDATAIVNSWAGGAFNWGVQLKADNEAATSGFRKIRSSENGDPAKTPKLVLTYNSYPSKASGTSTSPGNTYGSTTYVTSTTPTVSTVVTDPDGGALRGFFEVYNSAGTTLLWSGASDWSTSGSRVSKAIGAGVMSNGGTYKIAAYSQDATLKSQSAEFKTVTVDTTAPSTTITNTAYTNNTWTETVPSSNNFTLNGPNDTAVFDTVIDGTPRTVPANGSGDFTFPFYPVAEWNTIVVNAVDKAGNRGPTATFNFGSGAPGFTTPRQNGIATSTFPLDISAPPGSTGATLRWKLDNETSWRATGTGTITAGGSPWTGAVTTSGGRTKTGQLLWDATAEEVSTGVNLEAPALVKLQACFHYTSTADKCTYARTLQLVPSAFGGNYPVTSLGPATVALHTGEATIGGMDAADSKAGISRTFTSYDDATVNTGAFGPGWSDPGLETAASGDTPAEVVDNIAKDGTYVIVYPDGGSQTFVLDSGSTYVPFDPTGDATNLVHTEASGGNPETLVLSRPLGVEVITTTWELTAIDGGDPEWAAVETDAPGTQNDTKVETDATTNRPVFIRESDPAASTTCTKTTQTVGCRGLKITYTGTGAATRVSAIARVIGAATPGAVQTKNLATYTYTSGKLTSACSAIPAPGKPALCTGYAYATVAGRTVISEVTPPGLKKWRFAYDTSGRLLNVKRERPTGGDSTWSIDYSLTPASSGLPDLGATAAAEWGQTTIPTKVYAVYEPYAGSASITKAALYYTTADGTATNTASYGPAGWMVDTSWLNDNGDEVRHLDTTGWARVQTASAADRPAIAAEASSYTLYNTWGGDDIAGTLVVDEYGPAHTATLKDGTVGMYRAHTHTMYDSDPNVDTALIADRPTSAGDLGLTVKTTQSASNAAMTADYDTVHTKYGYGPIVSGDADGWDLGTATSISTQIDSTTWSTQITRYDADGREIESRRPGGTADGSGAGNDAHSTVTTYYTDIGSGDCGGKPAWDGLVCKTGPAAQPSGTPIPITWTSNYNDELQPATIQEWSGGTLARTTTTIYDNLDRVTQTVKATSGPGVTNETITTAYGYNDTTGLPTTTTSAGDTITTGYDTWGRITTYADAFGATSATTYDSAGNTTTFSDGTASYSYTYDGSGVLSSLDVGSGIGSFDYAYDAAGNVASITYPNGVVVSRDYDEVGATTALIYRHGTTELLAFTATVDARGRTVARSSSASDQQLTHDELGRLAEVRDRRFGGCLTRSYSFDGSSNRAGNSSYGAGTDGACQKLVASTSRANSHDSAGRISNPGYVYDTLGRTLVVPEADAGPNAVGGLSATFHADDMVASLQQTVATGAGTESRDVAYALDPAERVSTVTTTIGGNETQRLRYRYSSAGDSPTRIETSNDSGATWPAVVRYISVPALGMVSSDGGPNGITFSLPSLQGDSAGSVAGTELVGYDEADEFGNYDGPTTSRYRWLGAYQRSTDTVGGLVQMGARIYNPRTGTFISPDPVRGGNATPYGYVLDPINETDLTGMSKLMSSYWMDWGTTQIRNVSRWSRYVPQPVAWAWNRDFDARSAGMWWGEVVEQFLNVRTKTKVEKWCTAWNRNTKRCIPGGNIRWVMSLHRWWDPWWKIYTYKFPRAIYRFDKYEYMSSFKYHSWSYEGQFLSDPFKGYH